MTSQPSKLVEALNGVFARPQPPTYWATPEVLRVDRVSPRVRRVTLGGEGLTPFLAGYQPGDAVKFVLTETPSPEPNERWEPGLPSRAYTLINPDREAGTAQVDIIDHGDGPGSAWAGQAEPGWRVLVGGPRFGYTPDPAARAFRLFADLSALPAAIEIGRAIVDRPVSLAIEVPDAEEVRDLPAGVVDDVTWLIQDGGPGRQLVDHVHSLDWAANADVHVWVAGEAGTIGSIRRFLRVEQALPRAVVTVSGYWKLGEHGIDAARVALAAELARSSKYDGNQYDLDSFEPEVDGV